MTCKSYNSLFFLIFCNHHYALDLAGSREQRGSAFELYRKPQIGTTGHHHNLR